MTVLSYRFKYDGLIRHVDNVAFQNSCIKGYEMRKGGKFSFKTKSYRFDKIQSDLERVVIERKDRPAAPAHDAILMVDHVRLSDVLKGKK